MSRDPFTLADVEALFRPSSARRYFSPDRYVRREAVAEAPALLGEAARIARHLETYRMLKAALAAPDLNRLFERVQEMDYWLRGVIGKAQLEEELKQAQEIIRACDKGLKGLQGEIRMGSFNHSVSPLATLAGTPILKCNAKGCGALADFRASYQYVNGRGTVAKCHKNYCKSHGQKWAAGKCLPIKGEAVLFS